MNLYKLKGVEGNIHENKFIILIRLSYLYRKKKEIVTLLILTN